MKLPLRRLLTHLVSKADKKHTCDLPMELWITITSYLSREELCKLMGVNRALYKLAMDAKYGVVEFTEMNPRVFVRKAESLLDPSNARHVQALIVYPEAVHTAVEWSMERSNPKPDPNLVRTSILPPKRKPHFAPAFVHSRVSNLVSVPHKTDLVDAPIPNLSSLERKELYARALQMLSNMIHLEVHFRPDPACDWRQSPNQYLITEVVDLWTFLPLSNLLDVTLTMEALMFMKLFADINLNDLRRLRRLNLRLRFCGIIGDGLDVSVVSDVINSTRGSLEQLQFTAWGHHPDFSPILNGIDLPGLDSLSLRIPFDAAHIRDASCFMSLLDRHRLIKHVMFRNMACPGHAHPIEDGPDAHSAWLSRALRALDRDGQPMVFPAITSLHLGFKPLWSWGRQDGHEHQAKLAFLFVNLCPNVSDMQMSAMVFPFECLKNRLGSFGHAQSLTKLKLFADKLTPELVLLFADKCPKLQCLILYVNVVFSVGTEGPLDTREVSGIQEFVRSMERYRPTNRLGEGATTPLQQWCLEDLSIVYVAYGVGWNYCWEAMQAIARCVPALKSFAGRCSLEVDRGLVPA